MHTFVDVSMSRIKQRAFEIITIFPQAVEPYANASILGRAQQKNLLHIRAHDLRQWTDDRHRTVDDTPYGGGPGMIMKVEPFDRAIRSLKKKGIRSRVILTSASGPVRTLRGSGCPRGRTPCR